MDLDIVRRRLDALASSRLSVPLDREAQRFYEYLSGRERELLRARVRAPKTPDAIFGSLRRSRHMQSLAFLLTDTALARSHVELSRADRL